MREAAKNGTNRRLNDTAAHLQDLNHQSRMQLVHIGRYINVWRDTLGEALSIWCGGGGGSKSATLCSEQVHFKRFCILCNYIDWSKFEATEIIHPLLDAIHDLCPNCCAPITHSML